MSAFKLGLYQVDKVKLDLVFGHIVRWERELVHLGLGSREALSMTLAKRKERLSSLFQTSQKVKQSNEKKNFFFFTTFQYRHKNLPYTI